MACLATGDMSRESAFSVLANSPPSDASTAEGMALLADLLAARWDKYSHGMSVSGEGKGMGGMLTVC